MYLFYVIQHYRFSLALSLLLSFAWFILFAGDLLKSLGADVFLSLLPPAALVPRAVLPAPLGPAFFANAISLAFFFVESLSCPALDVRLAEEEDEDEEEEEEEDGAGSEPTGGGGGPAVRGGGILASGVALGLVESFLSALVSPSRSSRSASSSSPRTLSDVLPGLSSSRLCVCVGEGDGYGK